MRRKNVEMAKTARWFKSGRVLQMQGELFGNDAGLDTPFNPLRPLYNRVVSSRGSSIVVAALIESRIVEKE